MGGNFCLSPPFLVIIVVLLRTLTALFSVVTVDLTERALCSRCRRRCKFVVEDEGETGDLQI